MQRKLGLRAAMRIGVALVVGAFVLATLAGSNWATPRSSPPAGAAQPAAVHKGGTAYWALPPKTTPDWIFPFASLQFFSVTNLAQFQYLMYRPLYFFGAPRSSSPNVDYPLSLARAPVWSNGDRTVRITMKGWKFADGQTVDAQSLVFWLNMMMAEPANWAGTTPGSGQFPGNLKSYSAPQGATGDTVVINLDHPYNTSWYLYNELSQLVPMPEAWDVTSLSSKAGSGHCGAVAAGNMTGAATKPACIAVWAFDTDDNNTAKKPKMAGDLATYASNGHWSKGADGPWKLAGFDASTGQASFVPNPSYSGPRKPILSRFVEVPYSSASSELSALVAGGPTAPEVGYLPLQNTPQKPAGLPFTAAGPNAPALRGRYTLVQSEQWQINYMPENFKSTFGAKGHAGAVFQQLYFRQALQELVNQDGIISTYYKGYGTPTYGPVPAYPANSFAHGAELRPGGPYPFDPPVAIATLKAHGWSVVTNGTSRCVKPGTGSRECGAGIPSGTPLSFTEVYATGIASLTQTVDYEASEWAKAGIHVSVVAEPIDKLFNEVVPCYPTATQACHAWDMANWGAGWLYSPDYLPTGEETFGTGAGSNQGDYSSATNDRLIVETNQSSSLRVYYEWEDFLAKQLPVIWQPLLSGEVEIPSRLGGVLPVNALLNLTPEYWYLKS